MKEFLKRKNVVFSAKRYGIDCLGAMAQGLFASLLIGTIISTLGEQFGIAVLVTIGGYAKAATGAAMAETATTAATAATATATVATAVKISLSLGQFPSKSVYSNGLLLQ